jgi:hypothetical protein
LVGCRGVDGVLRALPVRGLPRAEGVPTPLGAPEAVGVLPPTPPVLTPPAPPLSPPEGAGKACSYSSSTTATRTRASAGSFSAI